MRLSVTADVPRRDLPAQPGTMLTARVGDTLLIEDGSVPGTARIGQIITVSSPDGSPPYRVRWLAGEYESLISPGPGARVQKGH